jgi:hypothetical protein
VACMFLVVFMAFRHGGTYVLRTVAGGDYDGLDYHCLIWPPVMLVGAYLDGNWFGYSYEVLWPLVGAGYLGLINIVELVRKMSVLRTPPAVTSKP